MRASAIPKIAIVAANATIAKTISAVTAGRVARSTPSSTTARSCEM